MEIFERMLDMEVRESFVEKKGEHLPEDNEELIALKDISSARNAKMTSGGFKKAITSSVFLFVFL